MMPAPTDIWRATLDSFPRLNKLIKYSRSGTGALCETVYTGADMIDVCAWVLRGGRAHDLRFTVWSASERDPDTIDGAMYWGRHVQEMGISTFTDRYNSGREIQTIILSPLAPVKIAAYFMSAFRWFLLSSLAVLLSGVLRNRSRLRVGVGLLTLFTTAAVFGYLLMDNVRFMILRLLFTAVTATGVADLLWKDLVEARGAKFFPGARSMESTGSRSPLPGA